MKERWDIVERSDTELNSKILHLEEYGDSLERLSSNSTKINEMAHELSVNAAAATGKHAQHLRENYQLLAHQTIDNIQNAQDTFTNHTLVGTCLQIEHTFFE